MATEVTKKNATSTKIEKKPTDLPHIFLIDIDDTGIFRECAVVNEFEDGTIAYVCIDVLHPVDKARIKKVVTSIHADKYPLFELLSQARFSNGLNGLDYIHSNFVKMKRPKGARMVQQSLSNISTKMVSDTMIGSEFTNPAEAELDTATKQW